MFIKILLLLTGLAVCAEELTIDKDNYKGKCNQSIISFRFAVKWKCSPSGRLSQAGTLISRRYAKQEGFPLWMKYEQRSKDLDATLLQVHYEKKVFFIF